MMISKSSSDKKASMIFLSYEIFAREYGKKFTIL